MRKVLVSASSVLYMVLVTMSAQAQDRPRTTPELVRLALERNRDLLSARERVAEASGLLRRSGLRPNPTVEVDYGTGRPVGSPGDDEVSVSYFHPIELGGKRGKREAVGLGGVAAAEAALAERTRQLIFDVKTRVAEVQSAQAKSAALAEMMTAGRESLRLTRARVSEGDAAALEGQLLAAEIARVEAQHATYRGRSIAALLDLRRTVGLDAGNPLSVIAEPADHSGSSLVVIDLKARALEARPDLRGGSCSGRAGGRRARPRTRRRSPRRDRFGDIQPGYEHIRRHVRGHVLGAVDANHRSRYTPEFRSVDSDFHARTQRRQRRRRTRAIHGRQAAPRVPLESVVPQEVEAAYERWAAAGQTATLFRRGVIDQSEQNLTVMREAYTLGQLRLIDVLNEQRRFVETRLAHIDAETELAQAAADL